ncbi:guanylate kinase [Roseiconus nitratireducens]|uniref:Guanylate kinase n=1 Tax=Roseiconus nitratireducens TaxID=2605748 RepID=A0A5M6D8J7_9BACT|nr:guanylate kinase [Roseiconus nitratireducens]KAA5543851.1 guanylate kinase [Roseiconus nitratireducens]
MNSSPQPRLIILSGPSGAGKSTVVRRLLSECSLPLRLSVSATTRPARPGERDGREYHFLSAERFNQLRSENAFLECKEVFGRGHWYGTLRSEVRQGLEAGDWVILEIDVQGAIDVMDDLDLDAISLFIHPGGMDELERRLRARGTETEDGITRRLETAADEMRFLHRYQYEIINGSVDRAVGQICQILNDQMESQACSKN